MGQARDVDEGQYALGHVRGESLVLRQGAGVDEIAHLGGHVSSNAKHAAQVGVGRGDVLQLLRQVLDGSGRVAVGAHRVVVAALDREQGSVAPERSDDLAVEHGGIVHATGTSTQQEGWLRRGRQGCSTTQAASRALTLVGRTATLTGGGPLYTESSGRGAG